MIKQLVVIVLTSLLLGTVSVKAEEMTGQRIWQNSSAENFPAFYRAMEKSGWIQNGQILRGGIGQFSFDYALRKGYLNQVSEEHRNPETFGRMMFLHHGLVDENENIRESISIEEFRVIGQGRGWFIPVNREAAVKLASVNNALAELQRRSNDGKPVAKQAVALGHYLDRIATEIGEDSAMPAVATLREGLMALQSGTLTPAMKASLDKQFAGQIATLRGDFLSQLSALSEKTDRQFTAVNNKISRLESKNSVLEAEVVRLTARQESLEAAAAKDRDNQAKINQDQAKTNQVTEEEIKQLTDTDIKQNEQFANFASNVEEKYSSHSVMIIFLVAVIAISALFLLWQFLTQRPKDPKNKSEVSTSSKTPCNDADLFDVKSAAVKLRGLSNSKAA